MNKQFRGTAINALTTKGTPIGTDVVLAEDSENKFSKVKIPVSALGGEPIKRVDVANNNLSEYTQYPVELVALSRFRAKFKYIFEDNYEVYWTILFWEFITPTKYYKDMRFDTMAEANSFVNTTLISDDGSGNISEPFTINIYLRQKTVGQSLNKIVNYNGLISKLRGSGKLQSRTAITLANTADGGREHPAVDDFIQMIYDTFTDRPVPTNAKNTIGIPGKYSNLYSLIPTKFAKGKKYLFPLEMNASGKRLFDKNTDTVVDWETTMSTLDHSLYYYTSTVIAEYAALDAFTVLGENPAPENIFTNYSSVRVYALVDNLLNPRYYYFMVKPIGVDQFIIPYIPEITEGAPLKCGAIITDRKGNLYLSPDIAVNDSSMLFNSNRSFRVSLHQTRPQNKRMIGKTLGKNDNKALRFFAYDDTTGLCTQFTEQFDIMYRVSGSTMKVMPNRKNRNDK